MFFEFDQYMPGWDGDWCGTGPHLPLPDPVPDSWPDVEADIADALVGIDLWDPTPQPSFPAEVFAGTLASQVGRAMHDVSMAVVSNMKG